MNIEICKKCKYCNDYIVTMSVFKEKHRIKFHRYCFVTDDQFPWFEEIFEYPEMYNFCKFHGDTSIIYDFNMNQFPYIEVGVSTIENKMKNFIKNKLFFKKCPYYIEHQIDNWNGEK